MYLVIRNEQYYPSHGLDDVVEYTSDEERAHKIFKEVYGWPGSRISLWRVTDDGIEELDYRRVD